MYVTAFVSLAVPAADWYYAPLMPGVALLTARGVQGISEVVAWLIRQAGRQSETLVAKLAHFVSVGIAIVLITILLKTLYPASKAIVQANPDWKAQVYPTAGRWIAQNTNTSARHKLHGDIGLGCTVVGRSLILWSYGSA